MPIKVYVSRDSEGRPWPPDNGREASACIDVIKRLWWAFASQSTLYAVAINLHQPRADFVVLSEHGIGVLEFTHRPGRIRQEPDGTWYAHQKPIRAGAASQGYKNPRFQVQAYAGQLRDKLIHPESSSLWLPGNPTVWDRFKFQTGVCFTHPDAHVADLDKSLRQQPHNLPWEDFSVLTPSGVPDWVASLRFEARQGRAEGFEPYRLTPAQILVIVARLLWLVEWSEIKKLMPTGAPYAQVEQVKRPNLSEQKTPTIFISYAHEDEDKARALCKALKVRGFKPWLDKEEVLPGEDWDLRIRKSLKASDFLIVCLSNKSINKRGYVQREIKMALDIAEEMPEGAIFLIPVRLEECSVPDQLQKFQYVDWPTQDSVDRVERAILIEWKRRRELASQYDKAEAS